MKRTISILSVLAFVLAFSSNVFAQTEVTASASIDAAVDATVDQNIDFGSLSSSQNVDAVLDPTGTNSNVGTGSPQHGKVTVTASGSGARTLNISWTATDLTDGSGNSLTYNEAIYGNSSDTPSGATELSSGDTDDSDTSGNYYIYLGGALTGSSINNATGGTYEGTVTITLEDVTS